MKIRLLDNPGYVGMENAEFPAVVEGRIDGRKAYIPRDEMYRIGAESGVFGMCPEVCIPVGFWEKTE